MRLLNPRPHSDDLATTAELDIRRDKQGAFFVSCLDTYPERSPSVATIEHAYLVWHVWYRWYARRGYTLDPYENLPLPPLEEDRFSRAVNCAYEYWAPFVEAEERTRQAWQRHDDAERRRRYSHYSHTDVYELYRAALDAGDERRRCEKALRAAQRAVEHELGVFPRWPEIAQAWGHNLPITLDMADYHQRSRLL